ncbi:MAG: response regulator transcription factor [Rubrivivax sp.]|nr:response regulator transcription factor [Rubrivivax sp.]
MKTLPRPTALIADDEPLLAEGLQADLAALWPELEVTATVRDGASAFEQALALRPDVCFLDIRMPGMDGLEAARALVEDWPQPGPALPLLVFVTAYDQHALAAFEAHAVDYLVKPVDRERLGRCATRLKGLLAREREGNPAPEPGDPGKMLGSLDAARLLEQTIQQLQGLAASSAALASASRPAAGPAQQERLTVVQAQVGSTVHLVPVEEVLYFEAADKYVRVVTAEREHLIRTSLRELLPRLDPAVFWQVHRGTVVQARCITSAQREESGIVRLRLRGHKDVLTASRLYAHLFRGM